MAIQLKDLRVACILDEFSYECFKHECTLIKFGPQDWKKTLISERPHLLLVESAWRGNDSSWEYKISGAGNLNNKEVKRVVQWCKKRRIPTVFWNKEDPVHFHNFINTAKFFDYIYTTDANSIPKYLAKVSHNNVFSLPFAAQPKIHNPITRTKKSKNICFAGSYYGSQHLGRSLDMEYMLSTSASYGLEIFDRNYSVINSPFRYPLKFQRYIKGSLPYTKLLDISKSYKICLNVNTVKNSPTMCSRRVFELLASGVYVISNYSKAVEEFFKNIVYIAKDESTLSMGIERALENSNWRTKKELQGIRTVLENHTYAHRLATIAKNSKIKVKVNINPRIEVFSYVNTYTEAVHIINSYKRQKYKYKDLTLFISASNQNQLIKGLAKKNDVNLVIVKGTAIQLSQYMKEADYIAYMSSLIYYGPYYLNDMVNGIKFSDVHIIGKKSYFEYFEKDNRLVLKNPNKTNVFFSTLQNTASIIHSSVVMKKNLLISDFLNLNELQRKTRMYRKFSINPYNFILNIPKDLSPSKTLLKEINL